MQFLFFKTLILWITLFIHGFNCISFSIFLWKWKTNESKNLLNLKMRVNYLNFVFRNEVKTKSKYRILNFVFQFIKNTKWHFGYTDWVYCVKNTEHNIKQNISTGMEVISLFQRLVQKFVKKTLEYEII